MNGSRESITQLVSCLNKIAPEKASAVEVVVAPPTCYLEFVKQNINSAIGVAAQNCYKVVVVQSTPPSVLAHGGLK